VDLAAQVGGEDLVDLAVLAAQVVREEVQV